MSTTLNMRGILYAIVFLFLFDVCVTAQTPVNSYIYNETGLFETLDLNTPSIVKFSRNNSLSMKRTSAIGNGIVLDVDCVTFPATNPSNPAHIAGPRSLFNLDFDTDRGPDGTINYEFEFSDALSSNGYMIFVDVDFKEVINIKAYKANGDLIPYTDFVFARENGGFSGGSTFTNVEFQDIGSTYSGRLTTLTDDNQPNPVVTIQCNVDIKKVILEFDLNSQNEASESKGMSFGFTNPTTPSIIYVKPTAIGSNNGSSWNDAYTSLQAAFENSFAGDEVWVAKGTYKPSSTHYLANTSRNQHFRLPEGVKVFGGFSGSEMAVSERVNFGYGETNNTLLSGDLSGDDNYSGATWTGTGENTYHVVYQPDEESCKLSEITVFDGFSISGGNADGSGTDNNNDGGGIFIEDHSPVFRNIDLVNNSCNDRGGGIYIIDSKSVIENLIVINNISQTTGAEGGGFYILRGGPSITNALVTNNYALTDGGGMYIEDSDPVFINATIANNRADDDGGGIYLTGASTDTLWLKNSILWGNTAGDQRNQLLRNSGRTVFQNSLYSNSNDEEITPTNTFNGLWSNNLTSNPKFINPDNSDFRIRLSSPAADAGNSLFNALSTDIRRGNFSRKLLKTDESMAGPIDMGAYEYYRTTDVVPFAVEVIGLQAIPFCPGLASNVQTFSLITSDLLNTVNVTAPNGFEIRKTGDANFASMITLPINLDGTLVTSSVDIRVAASATVSMTAIISITSVTETVSQTVTATAAPPDIINVQGNNINIFAGDDNPDTADDTQFGIVTVNKPATKTYTIQNTGGRVLKVSAISLTGLDATSFSIGGITFPKEIASNSSTTFTVTINANTAGLKTATVVISSDDNCSVISQN